MNTIQTKTWALSEMLNELTVKSGKTEAKMSILKAYITWRLNVS